MTTRKFSRPSDKDPNKKAKATPKAKKDLDIDKLTPKQVAQMNPRMVLEAPEGGPDPAQLLSPRMLLDHGTPGPQPGELLEP